jgi:glycosyltransferase involved in cell wall biosynthesis
MNHITQPLVSIVTPVYNGEKYLAECIECVLQQTYQNWEYFIVNNCSTDRSLAIAQKYGAGDSRIRVIINKDFLTALQNHNHALRHISPQSKYCQILQVDDLLVPQCIELKVRIAEARPSIGIVGSYALRGDKVVSDRVPFPTEFISGRELCRLTLLGKVYLFPRPASLLFRSELIRARNCFYNESHLHADAEVCYEILQDHDFGFVHQVLTFIRIHNESTTSLVAEPFNKIILNNLDLFIQFGPVYLEDKEYATRLKQKINEYYRFLARSLFQLREREFWEYHTNGIKKLGYKFSVVKLLRATLLELTGSFIKTVATILQSIKAKLSKR